jgi:hypothetical protein
VRKSEEKKQTVRTQEKSRGRFEVRTLTTTTNLIDDGYLKWPGVKQLIRLERRTVEKGIVRKSVTYGITSLTRDQADAAMLLTCLRGRWHIENRCFYVLDTRLGEDASRIRTGRSAQAVSAVRHAAINLARRLGQAVGELCEQHAAKPGLLLKRLCIMKL